MQMIWTAKMTQMTPTTVHEVTGKIALGNYTHVRKLNKVTQLKGTLTLVQVKLSHKQKLNFKTKLFSRSRRMKNQRARVTKLEV